MTWSLLLARPPSDLELHFRAGARRRPEGETLVVVSGGGEASVDLWQGEGHRRARRAIGEGAARELFEALARTGFPSVLGQTVPPGPGMIAVEVMGGPEPAAAVLHRSFVRDLPAWQALVDRLDRLGADLLADPGAGRAPGA